MAVKRSTILWFFILVIFAVLVVAWIDGGEEPLRTINQPVEIPEGAL